jgi:hypothetical protein
MDQGLVDPTMILIASVAAILSPLPSAYVPLLAFSACLWWCPARWESLAAFAALGSTMLCRSVEAVVVMLLTPVNFLAFV